MNLKVTKTTEVMNFVISDFIYIAEFWTLISTLLSVSAEILMLYHVSVTVNSGDYFLSYWCWCMQEEGDVYGDTNSVGQTEVDNTVNSNRS
jgi:hypothetical protein